MPITIMDLDEDDTLGWISGYDGNVSIYKMQPHNNGNGVKSIQETFKYNFT